jgi:cytochrome c oxidase cbb3-type subunit I/II
MSEQKVASPNLGKTRIVYDDVTVKNFMWASIGWGLVAVLVGLLAALQLTFWQLNFGLPWLTFGRIRPLHTNAAIFALVGNMIFAGVYYSTQRLCKVRTASDFLSKIHFWGWQLIILGAAITLPLGITQSKEYAELEWFLDLLVVLVWVAFAINFFWTLAIRNEKQLYVALWFYISTILTIAMLYIVNNLALPVYWNKSYGIFGGAQDALTQWWYGHNAVAFFLTTPILGIMYYFLPKAANRPVYSYRLSIVHFWALIFIYIWAGPHHLLYTALPDWAQSLGMLFSLMLWAPSWGGMLNGLLTLRGAWDKVRTDPVLKFFVAGVTFYGMSTFEGPLLSIKSVSALGHYTDWIIGHVHAGALGWNGFMAAGMFYWLVPRMYKTELFSKKLADTHFWVGTLGILIYVVAMWVAGVRSGLLWRAMTPEGALLYPDWVQIVNKMQLLYLARALGGLLFILGWGMMIYNIAKTIKGKVVVNGEAEVLVWREGADAPKATGLIFSRALWMTLFGMVGGLLMGAGIYDRDKGFILSIFGFALLLLAVIWAGFGLRSLKGGQGYWHKRLEAKPLAFSVLAMIAVAIGGIVELVPGLIVQKEVPVLADGGPSVEPYTPLELEGRDIYVREGCYLCHSQMIRPFRSEYLRYGAPSKLEESMYDHPFQWGSKRTGPDLAREGVIRSDPGWHFNHMLDPRSTSPESIMPPYPWLLKDKVPYTRTVEKLKALKTLGVPYSEEAIASCEQDYRRQAEDLIRQLEEKKVGKAAVDSELVALIAYLTRLGHGRQRALGKK